MTDFVVAEEQLPAWLLERVPAIATQYRTEVAQQYGAEPAESPSAYFIFSFVLRPYIERLLATGDDVEVRRIFELLEYLANEGDPTVQSGLNVTMEEVDVSRVAKVLGLKMTEWEFDRVSEYPHGPGSPENRHVDATRYRQRWCDEIEKIGGLKKLTLANELMIRHALVSEFGISGMQTPKPRTS